MGVDCYGWDYPVCGDLSANFVMKNIVSAKSEAKRIKRDFTTHAGIALFLVRKMMLHLG
jgi:uncharacterized protein YktA (UPF0223 family)